MPTKKTDWWVVNIKEIHDLVKNLVHQVEQSARQEVIREIEEWCANHRLKTNIGSIHPIMIKDLKQFLKKL